MISYLLDFNPTDASSFMSVSTSNSESVLSKFSHYLDQIGNETNSNY